jgi:hypothetical protein
MGLYSFPVFKKGIFFSTRTILTAVFMFVQLVETNPDGNAELTINKKKYYQSSFQHKNFSSEAVHLISPDFLLNIFQSS